MRFGSLFTGIGGLDLGLERAGMTCAWQVEIDEYARRVLAKRFFGVPVYNDIRRITGTETTPEHPQLVGRVDLLCGGFPCQDISVAGKGAGLDGKRSGLWFEYARIIDEIRPTWVLIENVPALRTRGLRRVLSDLHACGYDAEWDGLSASAVGAPHRRDRLFVVANSRGHSLRHEPERDQREGRGVRAALSGDTLGQQGTVADADREGELREGGSTRGKGRRRAGDGSSAYPVAYPDRPRLFQQRRSSSGEPQLPAVELGGWWAVEPDVGRMAHGVPKRVDRLRCLGNAVVPQVAEHVGRLILAVH